MLSFVHHTTTKAIIPTFVFDALFGFIDSFSRYVKRVSALYCRVTVVIFVGSASGFDNKFTLEVMLKSHVFVVRSG